MRESLVIFGLIISLGLSMTLLYMRKIRLILKLRFYIFFIFLISGVVGFLMTTSRDFRFLFYSMLVPVIYILFDSYFMSLSYKLHKRDFILYLRKSPDLEYKSFMIEDNDHVKASDILFSFGLLIIILGLTFFGVSFFSNEDIYYKWF